MKKHNKNIPAAAKLNLLRQICNFIPDFLVPKLARATGVQDKARSAGTFGGTFGRDLRSHILTFNNSVFQQRLMVRIKCSMLRCDSAALFFAALFL